MQGLVGQTLGKLQTNLERRNLGAGDILLEAERRALLAGVVQAPYQLTLVLEDRANLAKALRQFSWAKRQLARMLA